MILLDLYIGSRWMGVASVARWGLHLAILGLSVYILRSSGSCAGDEKVEQNLSLLEEWMVFSINGLRVLNLMSKLYFRPISVFRSLNVINNAI